MKIRGLAVMWLALFCGGVAAAVPAPGKASFDRRPQMLQAMVDEMQRSLKQLRMDDFEPAYFIALECKQESNFALGARYGALIMDDSNRRRLLRTEVRVGSYGFDNIGDNKEEYDFTDAPTYFPDNNGTIDDDPVALRNSFWLMMDVAYKNALKSFLKRRSKKITEVDDGKKKLSFSREKAVRFLQPASDFPFRLDYWRGLVREISGAFEKHPQLFDSSVTVEAKKFDRWLVNSEGSRIISSRTIYSMSVFGAARAPDGLLLRHSRTIHAQSEGDLPSREKALELANSVAGNLEALRAAPILEPYTGPAILDGEATGVLFHEVIGHRLEGERQLDDREGKTFKEQIGKQVIPEFLSVFDDPTLVQLGGVGLNGHYLYDDEAVAAQRVVLIEKGKLKNFLLSRTPVEEFTASNGHGRAAAGKKTRARMAVTIVKSDREVPFDELKQMLLDEVKRQGKPYGLIIRNIVGGSTHTYTWGYQAYKGVPEMVYRVYQDGREELVRGVEIVGTPIASINKIVATSDHYTVFNGYCGAESGYVPVSAYAPDVLMTEIELQRKMQTQEKPPILPSPWSGTPDIK